MRSLPMLCLLLAACSNGPVEHANTADEAARLGGKAAADFQLRVTGVCPAGQFAQSVGADGTVTCAVPAVSAADILGVSTGPGSGLTGGAELGEVSLALAVCPAGQLLKRDASGWACAADADLLAATTCTLGQVLRFDGTSWACAADADLLAGTACALGQVLRFDGTRWICAADADSFAARTCPLGQVLKSTGSSWLCSIDDTMNSMSCPAGQVLKSNGAGWECAADQGLTGVSTLAGTGLIGGGVTGALALALAPCADGQVFKAIDGGWACAADTVGLSAVTTAVNGGLTGGASALSLTGCAAGEVLKSNGTSWACAPDTTGLTGITPASGRGLTGGAADLALASCAAGEVLKSTGGGNWTCQADVTNTGDITSVITPAAGGLIGATGTGDATLAIKSCANNEVLKFSTATGWTCSADVTNTGDMTGVVTPVLSGLIGGSNSGDATLSLANCPAGQLLKSNGPGDWSCQADVSNTGDITSVITPAAGGLVGATGAGDATLALKSCANNEVLKFSTATGWTCSADVTNTGDMTGVVTPVLSGLIGGSNSGDATLSLANCPAGQLLKSNGPGDWSCQADVTNTGDLTGIITAAGSGLAGGSLAGDSTLTLAPCTIDQVLRFDGSQWSCAAWSAPYAAGPGLILTGSTFSADFTIVGSENGSATTVARADHLHDLRYALKPVRTIVVRAAGTPVQNGDAMRAAVNGIVAASAANPYLIKLEPGQYDLGASRYLGKAFVDLEGSGRTVTSVYAASTTGAVVEMVGASEIRELSVTHVGGSTDATAVLLSTVAGATTAARRVNLAASGGLLSQNLSMGILGAGFATVEDSTFATVVPASPGYGSGIRAGPGTRPTLRRVQISVAGDTGNGIHFSGTTLTVEDSAITSTTDRISFGLNSPVTGANISLGNTIIRMQGGSDPLTRGIEISSSVLNMRGGRIEAFVASFIALSSTNSDLTLRGVELFTADRVAVDLTNGSAGPVRRAVFEGCLLSSNTASPLQIQGTAGGFTVASIGNSRLASSVAVGPILAGNTLKCVTSYSESYDPLNAACN